MKDSCWRIPHQPTVLKGTNDMRVFQEEIFGPVVALTTFSSTEEAINTQMIPYGLGAGVCLVMLTNYSKFHVLFKQVEFVNQYNTYPAHAPLVGKRIRVRS
jgi:aldehyde dehydrogenase (NAD+)/aldehyde dehydrogenase